MRVPVLQVGVDGKVGRAGDRPAVLEHLVAAHGAGAIGAAEAVRQPQARRGEGLEAERREEPRRAGVPRIRDDEGARALVERPERGRSLRLGAHGDPQPPGASYE